VDGLVVHRREEGVSAFTDDDREFKELTELARALSMVQFQPPDDFRNDLRGRLPRMSEEARATRRGWFGHGVYFTRWQTGAREIDGRRLRSFRHVTHTAAAMAPLLALVATFVWHVGGARTVSAAEILTRADEALAKLVHDGQILHRRWKVVDAVRTPDGREETVRESISNEWMDGADFTRVAGRNEARGRVYLAYVTVREAGEIRPRVYFAPGFSNEPLGLLSIEPSRREFQDALDTFGEHDRDKLRTYLNRGYIFEPISGERRFNRIALETSTETNASLPRVMVSLREERLASGVDVYAVRIVDPARVRFRWRSEGAPTAWLEWRETVRYIARDTYLSLRAEETYETENGHRIYSTRELLETRILERGAIHMDPFDLTVPEGTPVRRQSAREQLSAVAGVLRHLPAHPTH
jgi:hypothetical protein